MILFVLLYCYKYDFIDTKVLYFLQLKREIYIYKLYNYTNMCEHIHVRTYRYTH